MKNWERKKLGEICDFVRGPFGGSLKKNIFKPNGYAVYEQQHAIYDQFEEIRYFIDENKFNEMRRFELNPGDLIMSCSGTMGKIAIVPENIRKGIINQALLKLSPSKKVLNSFLKLWMQSESFQDSLKKYSGGAAIQNVASVAVLKDIEIPLPSLPEQKRIVSILDEAFDSINKAKENAVSNFQNARNLFAGYLQSIFENNAQDWQTKALKEVCEKITDGTHQTPKYFDQGIIFLSSKNVTSGKIDWDNIKYIDEKQHREMHKRVAPRLNDILLAKNGTTGVAAMVDRDVIFDIYVSLAHIRVLDKVLPKFMLYFINSHVAKKQFNKRLKGSGVPNLHLEEIREVIISFPASLTDQQAIINQLDALSIETKKLESIYQQKLDNLEELKKSILQKAFSGELSKVKLEAV